MKFAKYAGRALAGIGALNWGLVALARFDLVAQLFGRRFGETRAITRVIYGAVGLAGLMEIIGLFSAKSRDEAEVKQAAEAVPV